MAKQYGGILHKENFIRNVKWKNVEIWLENKKFTYKNTKHIFDTLRHFVSFVDIGWKIKT